MASWDEGGGRGTNSAREAIRHDQAHELRNGDVLYVGGESYVL